MKARSDAFTWGYMDALQDRCENCPFASVGGLDRRTDMAVPGYVPQAQHTEYLRGYRAYCDEQYGQGWETARWVWTPALPIDPKGGTICIPKGEDEDE